MSRWSSAYQPRLELISENHLSSIAKKAGLGRMKCMEEPKGALAWCLREDRISEDEARQGVVVVDFGGGTLDMALVDENGVREPWGDPIVGGRLFDDLFYHGPRSKSGRHRSL